MQNFQQTAILLAAMLTRTNQSRARVSETTLKTLAGKQHLRADFVVNVMEAMADLNWIMIELDSSGFGLITRRALEGAKPVRAQDSLTESELAAIKRGVFSLAKFEEEVRRDEDVPSEKAE